MYFIFFNFTECVPFNKDRGLNMFNTVINSKK